MAEDVVIDREGLGGTLAGTLAGPLDSGRAGVVIIPGSGPTDRDGNNPLGVTAAPYRLLAEGLAEADIASVRTDKRGMFASRGAIPNPNEVTIGDYAGDTLAWAEFMRKRTGASCAWLLGHSEGGLIALRSAVSAAEGICGVILVASPGRPIADVLREQLSANPGAAPLMPEIEGHLATLSAGERIESDVHPGLAALFGPQIQTFLISLFAHDPQALIGQIDLPLLVIQGSEDLQVKDSDAASLLEANPEAEGAMLAGVNHVLKDVPPGDAAANQASYGDPSLPISPAVVEAITEFVLRDRD